MILPLFLIIHIITVAINKLQNLYPFKEMALDSLFVGGGIAVSEWITHNSAYSPIAVIFALLGVAGVIGRVSMIYINAMSKYQDMRIKRLEADFKQKELEIVIPFVKDFAKKDEEIAREQLHALKIQNDLLKQKHDKIR